MSDTWDRFPTNIGEIFGPIERKSFTFNYKRFEVWQDGACIFSGLSVGIIVAHSMWEDLFVTIDDWNKDLDKFILKQFSFGEISTINDRMMWSKDIFNTSGKVERNNPDIFSLFFCQGKLSKVTFTIHDPNTLIEFYS